MACTLGLPLKLLSACRDFEIRSDVNRNLVRIEIKPRAKVSELVPQRSKLAPGNQPALVVFLPRCEIVAYRVAQRHTPFDLARSQNAKLYVKSQTVRFALGSVEGPFRFPQLFLTEPRDNRAKLVLNAAANPRSEA